MPRKRKPKVWTSYAYMKQEDGTLVPISKIEDLFGVMGPPKITRIMPMEELEEHKRKMAKNIAAAAETVRDVNGDLLPDGHYDVMDLLR